MRRIGTLTDGSQASRFCDYLVTQSIDAVAEEDKPKDGSSSTWDLWVRDEAHIDAARAELKSFQENPEADKYQVASKADEIRNRRVADQQRKLKQQKALQQKLPRSSGGRMMGGPARQQQIPVVIGIIALSVLCSFATGFGQPRKSRVAGQYSTEENLYGALSFVDWRDYHYSNEDAFANIKQGQIWRFITPMFMHGSTMHLAFNMMMLFFLGSVIERLHGSVFLAALTLSTHFFGMMLQVSLPGPESLPDVLSQLAGSPFAIGASGAIYGLFGYLWIRPSVDPGYPVRMDDMNVVIMLVWLVACVFVVKGIANGGHIGGFVSGMIAAVVVVQFMKLRAK